MMKQRWGLDRNVLRPAPGEQHHWNTGAKENQQLNPDGPSNRQKIFVVSVCGLGIHFYFRTDWPWLVCIHEALRENTLPSRHKHFVTNVLTSTSVWCLLIIVIFKRNITNWSGSVSNWATSRENMSSEIFDQVWLKSVCSATATR